MHEQTTAVVLDGRLREPGGEPYAFACRLDRAYRHISRVQVDSVTMGMGATEPYVVMRIAELDLELPLFFERRLWSMAGDSRFPMRVSRHTHYKDYPGGTSVQGRLTVTFHKYDGSLLRASDMMAGSGPAVVVLELRHAPRLPCLASPAAPPLHRRLVVYDWRFAETDKKTFDFKVNASRVGGVRGVHRIGLLDAVLPVCKSGMPYVVVRLEGEDWPLHYGYWESNHDTCVMEVRRPRTCHVASFHPPANLNSIDVRIMAGDGGGEDRRVLTTADTFNLFGAYLLLEIVHSTAW